jgi:hypothetical protein
MERPEAIKWNVLHTLLAPWSKIAVMYRDTPSCTAALHCLVQKNGLHTPLSSPCLSHSLSQEWLQQACRVQSIFIKTGDQGRWRVLLQALMSGQVTSSGQARRLAPALLESTIYLEVHIIDPSLPLPSSGMCFWAASTSTH